jgi:hypothetical protein
VAGPPPAPGISLDAPPSPPEPGGVDGLTVDDPEGDVAFGIEVDVEPAASLESSPSPQAGSQPVTPNETNMTKRFISNYLAVEQVLTYSRSL